MTKNRLTVSTLILLITALIFSGCGSQISTTDNSDLRKEKIDLDNYNSASAFWKMADAEIPRVTYEQAAGSSYIGTYVCMDTIGISSEEFDSGLDSWKEVDVELAIPKEDGSYYSYKNDVIMASDYMFKFGYDDLLDFKEGDKIRLCLYVTSNDLEKDYVVAAKIQGSDSSFNADQYEKNASAQYEKELLESQSVDDSTEANASTDTSQAATAKEYDTLQTMFINLTTSTTEDELLQMIQDGEVVYTKESYNGSPKEIAYKIAYTDGAAQQSHAESGDYLQVNFSEDDGSFMYAEYSQKNSFRVSLLYNYGIYWDFREDAPSEYSGFYYYTSGDTSKTGITIKYSNGYEVKTAYHQVNSAEAALP